MGEDEAIERWIARGKTEKRTREMYREVVEDLIECAAANEACHYERAANKDKAMWFDEIVTLSIRYAHACSKQHPQSAGMRAKVRSELLTAIRQWGTS